MASSSGANDYITKPVDFPVALARIHTQLSHRRAEQALRESEERYALAAQGANDGLWDWNLKNNTIYFSPRWKSMLGFEDSEIGESPDEWFGRMHDADRDIVKQRIDAYLNGETTHFECEARLRHKDGVFRWMLSRGIMVRDQSGKPLRMAGSQTDITEGKVADPLTGLPNRLLFADRLLQLIEHRKRNPDSLFAVLFLDLDGFKMVNDSLGHVLGDKMLVAVAGRLVNSLRQTDTVARMDDSFTVARLGGDEFAILLTNLKDAEDATHVANRLMGELTLPFHLDDKEVYTSASIGIAVSTSGYQRPEEFLRDADTAMYRAKSLGKARYEVFDADMRASVTYRLQLETDLRHALERNEFMNFYQPIISLETGKIAGFEALMRWQHPTRGVVEPGEFIPVAEEMGLIRELGWWGLCEACRQISEWRKQFPDLTMSVNLSVKQFVQPNFAAQLEKLLQEYSLSPGVLKLELTEGSIMADPAAAATLLSQMRCPWDCDRHRRFRHGLLFTELLAAIPLGYFENRQILHECSRNRRQGRKHHRQHHAAGAKPRTGCCCRRRGNQRAGFIPETTSLQICAGLPFLTSRERSTRRRAAPETAHSGGAGRYPRPGCSLIVGEETTRGAKRHKTEQYYCAFCASCGFFFVKEHGHMGTTMASAPRGMGDHCRPSSGSPVAWRNRQQCGFL